MSIVETRVPVSELCLGMHVTRLDRDWLETDFLLQGFTIRHADELRALQQTCEFVFVEGVVETGFQPAMKSPAQRIRYVNKISIEEELPRAANSYRKARSQAREILETIRMGRILDISEAKRVVDSCVESVLRNDQALKWLMQIKHKDAYTAEHSLNVCILSAIFGRHLGLVRSQIEQLALSGLLHDVGKIKVPPEILNKPGALTPEEFATMREHPSLGRKVLMSAAGTPAMAVDVAYSHHERIDGKGYPRTLKGEQIPYFAKIVALVDTYDAITSDRCYNAGRSSKLALDIIFRERGKQFDESLALAFIQCIGIYPPGAVVEMTNGEVGIVIAANPDNKLKPRVLLVRDADKKPCREKVVDLMRLMPDASGKPYVIARELANGSHGVNLASFLERGLVLRPETRLTPDMPVDLEVIRSWFNPETAGGGGVTA